MSIDDELTARYEIHEAIALAARLLTVAAENAKAVTPAIALPITTAIDADQRGSLSPNIESEFWSAFTSLCQIVQPVSAASFTRYYIETTQRHRRNYILSSIGLLIMLLPLSLVGFIVTSITADLTSIAESTCTVEQQLQCAKPPLSDQPNLPQSLKNTDLKSPQSVNFAGVRIYNDNKVLNHLVLFNPWTEEQLLGAFKCLCPAGETCPGGRTYKTCSGADRDDETKRDLAHTFEGNIYFARYLKLSSDVTYGALGAYILPPLYAMLGACAFGFRNLLGPTNLPLSSIAAMGPLVRLPLAALAGFIVGLFTDATKGLSISPLAIAFLVGYASEILFSILDALIETTKAASRRASTQ
jgi:hypothetical protein